MDYTQNRIRDRDIDIGVDKDCGAITTFTCGISRYAQRAVTRFMLKRVQSDGHASKVRHDRVFRTY